MFLSYKEIQAVTLKLIFVSSERDHYIETGKDLRSSENGCCFKRIEPFSPSVFIPIKTESWWLRVNCVCLSRFLISFILFCFSLVSFSLSLSLSLFDVIVVVQSLEEDSTIAKRSSIASERNIEQSRANGRGAGWLQWRNDRPRRPFVSTPWAGNVQQILYRTFSYTHIDNKRSLLGAARTCIYIRPVRLPAAIVYDNVVRLPPLKKPHRNTKAMQLEKNKKWMCFLFSSKWLFEFSFKTKTSWTGKEWARKSRKRSPTNIYIL